VLPTFCNSEPAEAPVRFVFAPPPSPPGPTPDAPPAPAAESRAYFRCHPLHATLSVQQCRANRARLSPHEALALPFDMPAWWVQPLPCWSCTLAPRVEAGHVPFYTAEQVLAGVARRESAAHSGQPPAATEC
jgi:hypothetical protein